MSRAEGRGSGVILSVSENKKSQRRVFYCIANVIDGSIVLG